MLPRVFVTGAGIVSAAGIGVDETLASFYNLRSGIGPLTLFDSLHKHIPVAEVKKSNIELGELAGVNIKDGKYSRNTLLMMVAAKMAAGNADLMEKPVRETGLVLATTVGGMDLNEQYYRSLLESGRYKNLISTFDSADSTEKIAAHFGIRYNVSTISTACSSSANAVMLGARLIKNNRMKRVMVGGADALTKFTINGFNSLEILSSTGCKPFDDKRNGLTIGEGAAVLILESEDIANPKSVLAEVTGYANVNEAYHATASSSEGYGAEMAMQKALDVAGLKPSDISYINAHGTGTEINDLSEGNAIIRTFGQQYPPVSSTKGFTGHTLGAAGAVEAVFSVMALKYQQLIPSVNFKTPMTEVPVKQVLKMTSHPVQHVITNSFGFGGSNTTLVLSKV